MRTLFKGRVILLLFLFMLFAPTGLKATPNDVLLELNFQNTAFSTILNEIAKQASLSIIYNVKDINANRKVTIKAHKENFESVMKRLLDDTTVSYSVKDKYLVLFTKESSNTTSTQSVNQQNQRFIKGTVVDEHGEPLIGVSIMIKGTQKGSITNMDGEFSIQASNDDVLEV